MVEINCPNQIFIAIDIDLNIVYQSAPFPPSWSFIEIPISDNPTNLKNIKMESAYISMIVERLEHLK